MKLTPEDQTKLRDKELANIIRKLNAGKTLTAREEAKLAAATAGEPPDLAAYVGTWDELAGRLGVTRRAIQDWRSDPRYRQQIESRRDRLERPDGRHCVAEWARLMVDLHLKRGKGPVEAANDPENADDDGEGLIKPPRYGGNQQDWVKAKIAKEVERKEIELETLRGTLLEAADLEVPLGATFASIQTKLASFPARVARYLVGLREIGEIEDKLRDEIDADLSDLQKATFTAEDAVSAAVASLPFDQESEQLLTSVCFAGQDRELLLQLIGAVATQALRQIGRRAIAKARSDGEVPDTAIADQLTGQVTGEAEEREARRRSGLQGGDSGPEASRVAAPACGAEPPVATASSAEKTSAFANTEAAAPPAKKKRRRSRPQPTAPPAAMEAAIESTRRKRR